MPQRLDIASRDPAKTESVGDIVHVAQKPRKAVDQRTVEIEDDEGVGHSREQARPHLGRNNLSYCVWSNCAQGCVARLGCPKCHLARCIRSAITGQRRKYVRASCEDYDRSE